MEQQTTHSYFNDIDISNTPKEKEPFEIYKARLNFTNKLIKQYLKGRLFYSVYQDIQITKDKDNNDLPKEKQRVIRARVLPNYVNTNKQIKDKIKTNGKRNS